MFEGGGCQQSEPWARFCQSKKWAFEVKLICLRVEEISGVAALWIARFLASHNWSRVTAAKVWNLWESLLGIASWLWGLKMALIHDSIGWAWKVEESKGHLRLSNVVNGFCRALQIGQFQRSRSVEWENLPMFDLTGSEFPTIFQSKCLSLCWSFKLQRQFQSVMSKGEVLAGWSWITNSWADFPEIGRIGWGPKSSAQVKGFGWGGYWGFAALIGYQKGFGWRMNYRIG